MNGGPPMDRLLHAYLIDTNGIVYDAQAWLDRYPEDIKSSISGLVGEDITGAPVPTGIVGLGFL